jgi:hypothetical protein
LCFWGPSKELYKPNPNPHLTEWHKHNPPPGTAYNPLPRFAHYSLVSGPEANQRIAQLHARAPYDRDITYNLLRLAYTEQGKQPTYEQCQEAYKSVLPYATYAMDAVADTIQDQPDRYEALMAQASGITLWGIIFKTGKWMTRRPSITKKGWHNAWTGSPQRAKPIGWLSII